MWLTIVNNQEFIEACELNNIVYISKIISNFIVYNCKYKDVYFCNLNSIK